MCLTFGVSECRLKLLPKQGDSTTAMVVVVEEGTCAHTNTNTLGARLKSTTEVPLRGAAAAETVVGE